MHRCAISVGGVHARQFFGMNLNVAENTPQARDLTLVRSFRDDVLPMRVAFIYISRSVMQM